MIDEKNQQKRNVAISVILPVYNVEPWIGECIDSLKKQKQEGLEFIFVDDCSTDGSLSVIESFAKEDSRVRILQNKENCGAGPSRNAGIEAARGEYLSFIDPDDWINDDFLERLYSKAKETGSDIAKGKKATFEDGQKKEEYSSDDIASPLNARIRERKRKKKPLLFSFTYEHTTAIYKRTLFSDSGIRYGTFTNAEDRYFLLKVCYTAKSITIVDEAVYYYRLRSGSTTGIYTVRRAMNELQSLEKSLDLLSGEPFGEEQTAYIISRLRTCTRDYYYATKREGISCSDEEDYYSRIRTIASQMGDERHCHGFTELEIYLKYRYMIPTERGTFGLESMEIVDAWTDFLHNYRCFFKRKIYSAYVNALKKTYIVSLGNAPMSADAVINYYKTRISGLGFLNRIRVIKSIRNSFR